MQPRRRSRTSSTESSSSSSSSEGGSEPLSNVRLVKLFFRTLVEECAQEPPWGEEDTAYDPFALGVVLNTSSQHARLCWTIQFDERGKLSSVRNGETTTTLSTIEVHETTVQRLLARDLSPIKAFLQRLIKITGDKDAWRRVPLAAIKRSALRLLPQLEQQFPFPSYSQVRFLEGPADSAWMPNLPKCQLCGDQFGTFTNRRHHCRVCGKCVCGQCSPHTLVGNRACVFCFQEHVTQSAAFERASKASKKPQKEGENGGKDAQPQLPPAKNLVERMERRLRKPFSAASASAAAAASPVVAALSAQVRTNLAQIRSLQAALHSNKSASSSSSSSSSSSYALLRTAALVAGFALLVVRFAPTSAFVVYLVLSQLAQRPRLVPAVAVAVAVLSPSPSSSLLSLFSTRPIAAWLAVVLAAAHVAFRRLSAFARLFDIYSACLHIILLYQAFRLVADRVLHLGQDTRERALRHVHAYAAPIALDSVLELKSVFVKFGQYLGARSDIMPPEWTLLLARLQDDMPVDDSMSSKAYIARLLAGMEGKLVDFDPVPIAAASIAQVHTGMWIDKDGGGGAAPRKVAIKIQHEQCGQMMRGDMAAFKRVIRLVCWLNPQLALTQQLLLAWEKEMLKELDFTQEVANLRETAQSLGKFMPGACELPQVLYSDAQCFVMTWMPGFKITDREQLAVGSSDLNTQLVNTLVAVYAYQVFVKGFFQADPHAGNLMVHTHTNQLVLLDFGMCVRLTEHERQAYCRLVYALGNLSVSALSLAMRDLGYENSKSGDFPEQDLEFFAHLLRDTSATREEAKEVDGQFREMRAQQQKDNKDMAGRRFQQFPESLLFIMRTFGLLRGLSTSLGASVSYMDYMLDYAKYGLARRGSAVTAPTTTATREYNSLERAVLDALQQAEAEGAVQVCCVEHGAVLCDVAFGTVSDCDAQPITASTLLPLLELTKVLESVAVLRALHSNKQLDHCQLLGPTIPSPPLWSTLNHSRNGLENAVHPSSFGHALRGKREELLRKVQLEAAASTTTPASTSTSLRHTLSFGYELDLALKFARHPPTSLAAELAPFNTAELNYGIAPQPGQHFADVSHGYVKDVQEMMMFAAASASEGKKASSSSPLSLTNLPVLPGRMVPDAMMVNAFRTTAHDVPSIGAFASARALCRFLYDAMKDVDFLKRVDRHLSKEEGVGGGGTWGMGFQVHREPLTNVAVFTHASFGGSFVFCVPEKRLCCCVVVSHLVVDSHQLTQRVVDLVCERSSIKPVPV